MALNLSPEKGVKLTKKDRDHVVKKIKQGWKGKVMIPDYIMGDDGNIYVDSPINRRLYKVIRFKDDGIYIEQAFNGKTLRIVWDNIAIVQPTNKIKDAIELILRDGKSVVFEIYNSYKLVQNTEFIINYINKKKFANNGVENIYG